MAFHDKLGRYAGGALDYLTRNRFDFDGLGSPKDMNFVEDYIISKKHPHL